MERSEERPGRREMGYWALGLGALFFLMYGTTNFIASGYEGLPSYYLSWETAIPFVSWMIVPYMSLDLLFIVAFFQVTNRAELHRHAGRITLLLVVSCTLFLIYPMQFGFTRPETTGLYGWLFGILAADLPYNQFPSLHISFSVIIWPLVRRMTSGWGRPLMALWFILIALSTLTVYQHHLIDVIGGIVVGLLVMYTIPLKAGHRTITTPQSLRIAARYALATAVAIVLAVMLGGWGLLLLYPALSLALVAAAYLSGRADFLQKRNGHHCLVTRLLFAPYLAVTYLVWRLYRDRVAALQHLDEGIHFGRRLHRDEIATLQRQGVTAILDLSPEVPVSPLPSATHYHHVPILDFAVPDLAAILSAVDFIKEHRNGIYIHCSLGLSRTAFILSAYLINNGMEAAKAIDRLRAIEPGIVIGRYATAALQRLTNPTPTTSSPLEEKNRG